LKPRAESINGGHEAQPQSLSFTTAVQRQQKAPAEAGAKYLIRPEFILISN
tara:strand:- start:1798 stop:1950 length:153 start_codon:yes stop_codon:yes gene_type:complete